MSDNHEEDKDIVNQKQFQYYSALYTAWLTTKLEKDKGFLVLSAGGIGLLVTLLTISGALSYFTLILFSLAALSFLICLISTLCIFDKNATFLGNIATDKSTKSTQNNLKKLDMLSQYSFIIGIIFSFVIALSFGINNVQTKKEIKMSKIHQSIAKKKAKKSFYNFDKLDPKSNVSQDQNKNTPKANYNTDETNELPNKNNKNPS